ncbi:hypothetical protein TVAG_109500 [Trichomonas vaginalis G3]|uniref:Vacuolar protein sorting-associated protein 54 C-terminal domain-containing protein n=1 Tax=Trichomonas vaginalis (strain ATCC PRA-98 / G3) TaxID=412133 RepID=A2EAD9_TRIV3|nr:vacuolar protein sorting-associated protein 54 family [Trichomonas vaginalis G3]EAY10366.1 hypothetical protein TVAG_109500 [Trichomonas vaginalis G3]KAI5485351.1 vacuolar protein sorting-associated protein 54 family [Trichomonas vaginalis G3]|eukprot:XP_001322589.1 hypothetical protein [Trichomonas vaginalis G3]
MQNEELKYPVQPFVFEFARDASKKLSFSDIQMKQPQKVDYGPIEDYLRTNDAFLREYEEINKPEVAQNNTYQDCQVSKIFYDPNFDLRKTKYFNEVFPSGCLKQRLFSEQLILQLDTIQNLLYHSSDNHALDFFQSFSAIHDMNSEIAALLPKVKTMRNEVATLQQNANAPNAITALMNKKSRLQSIQTTLDSMKRVVDAGPAAIAYAETGDFNTAFVTLDETIETLKSKLLQIKSMHSYLYKLQDTKNLIVKKLKDTFCSIFTRDDINISDIVAVIVQQNLLTEVLDYVNTFLGQYSHDQVLKIITQIADQDLQSISISKFTEALQNSFPIIRLKLFAKGTNTIESIASEFEKYSKESSESVKGLIQVLCNNVYEEVIGIISSQPLKNVDLDNFSAIYDSIINFGRGFDKCSINDHLLQQSLYSFGQQFIETFDKDLKAREELATSSDKWQHTISGTLHLEILRRLTTGNKLDNLVIEDSKFGVTASALTMLEIIWNYLEAARRIKGTADDFTIKLAAAISNYSRQCMYYIYEGAAAKQGKFKNTSTRHLSLASANIEFMARLISYITPRLETVGANRNIVSVQMQNVSKNLIENENKLNTQICKVLTNKISEHMSKIDLDPNGISPFVEKVVKEVNTLNNFINEFLPKKTVQMIMDVIGKHINMTISGQQNAKQPLIKNPLFQRDCSALAERLAPAGISIEVSKY